MDAAELKIKITSEVNGAVKGLQEVKTKTEELSKASVDSSGKVTSANSKITESTNKTAQGFDNMGKAATASKISVGSLVSSLGSMISPTTLLISAVAGIAIALNKWVNATDSVTEAKRNLNDAMIKGTASAAGEIANLNSLVRIAKDVKLSYDERQSAIERINKEYPALNGQISLERINTIGVTKAINDQNEALKRKASIKAVLSLIEQEAIKQEAIRFVLESGVSGPLRHQAIVDLQKSAAAMEVYTKRLDELNKVSNTFVFTQPADTVRPDAIKPPKPIKELKLHVKKLKVDKIDEVEINKSLTLFDKNGLINFSGIAPIQRGPGEPDSTTGVEKGQGASEIFRTLNADLIRAFKAMDDLKFKASETASIVQGTLMPVFDSVVDAIIQGNQKIGDVFASALKGIIAQLIKAAALAAVLSLISGGAAKGGFSFLSGLKSLLGGKVPGLAEGGVVPGGFPGDSYPALLTSGETVIPAHKLPDFQNRGTREVPYIAETRISGQDMRLLLLRADKRAEIIG